MDIDNTFLLVGLIFFFLGIGQVFYSPTTGKKWYWVSRAGLFLSGFSFSMSLTANQSLPTRISVGLITGILVAIFFITLEVMRRYIQKKTLGFLRGMVRRKKANLDKKRDQREDINDVC